MKASLGEQARQQWLAAAGAFVQTRAAGQGARLLRRRRTDRDAAVRHVAAHLAGLDGGLRPARAQPRLPGAAVTAPRAPAPSSSASCRTATRPWCAGWSSGSSRASDSVALVHHDPRGPALDLPRRRPGARRAATRSPCDWGRPGLALADAAAGRGGRRRRPRPVLVPARLRPGLPGPADARGRGRAGRGPRPTRPCGTSASTPTRRTTSTPGRRSAAGATCTGCACPGTPAPSRRRAGRRSPASRTCTSATCGSTSAPRPCPPGRAAAPAARWSATCCAARSPTRPCSRRCCSTTPAHLTCRGDAQALHPLDRGRRAPRLPRGGRGRARSAASGDFFARKVDTALTGDLLDRLDRSAWPGHRVRAATVTGPAARAGTPPGRRQ